MSSYSQFRQLERLLKRPHVKASKTTRALKLFAGSLHGGVVKFGKWNRWLGRAEGALGTLGIGGTAWGVSKVLNPKGDKRSNLSSSESNQSSTPETDSSEEMKSTAAEEDDAKHNSTTTE